MIRLEGASRTFTRASGEPVHALRGLDLEIRKGETLALLGPSGCGKTTTLRLINRLIDPTGGRVVVGGQDVAALDPVRLRRRMGYVIQQSGLFPHQTVADNVATVPRLLRWDKARIRARVDELLALVGLDPAIFRDRYPAQLSGGQQQRVAVARAMSLDPEILLMDEPFGALDPITRGELPREFRELEKLVAKTVVIVSHDLDEAFALGDRVALLHDGELAQLGTPDELRSAPASPWVERFLSGRTA
ncbi:MAG: ABC transporter ATP-binding protein [Vicinamibacteria bacterium]